MFCRTDRCGNRASSCGTYPMRRYRGAMSFITRPFNSMTPERGLRMPAISSSSVVLPAPDGPYNAVVPFESIAETSSVNSASDSVTSRRTSVTRPPQESLGDPDREKGDDHRDAEETKGSGVVSELHVVV